MSVWRGRGSPWCSILTTRLTRLACAPMQVTNRIDRHAICSIDSLFQIISRKLKRQPFSLLFCLAGNCWNLGLQGSDIGCQFIMTRLPTLLVISIAFAAISTFFMAALSISGIITLCFEGLAWWIARLARSYFPNPPQLEVISVNHLPSDSATAIATAVASPVSSAVPMNSSNERYYLNEDCIIILKPLQESVF